MSLEGVLGSGSGVGTGGSYSVERSGKGTGEWEGWGWGGDRQRDRQVNTHAFVKLPLADYPCKPSQHSKMPRTPNMSKLCFSGFQSGGPNLSKICRRRKKKKHSGQMFNFRQLFDKLGPPDWSPEKQSSDKFEVRGIFECCKGPEGLQNYPLVSPPSIGIPLGLIWPCELLVVKAQTKAHCDGALEWLGVCWPNLGLNRIFSEVVRGRARIATFLGESLKGQHD